MAGKVYLVGAGPGDPGLITLKGFQLLKEAEAVIYDFLASPQLLKIVPESAEILYVGKKGGDHTLPQSEINQLILRKALEGKKVVRLKGGDPFIFGRGGEEAEELARAGIPFEIVPGVTSAIAVPAYAGIPLTHRRFNSSVAFITGHEDPAKEAPSLDWGKLATAIETLVFLMGVKNLPSLVDRLIANGRAPETPASLIRWGTTPSQQTVTGTLADIIPKAQEAGLTPPAIFIIGQVVTLRETLNWFEKKSLFGKRIAVTRTREQASELIGRLQELGADCIEFPTIRLAPPSDWQELDQALSRLSQFNWIFFTSPNGVRFFFDRLAHQRRDLRELKGIKIAVIGPATARELGTYHLLPDLIPEKYQAEDLLEALSQIPLEGQRILIPRAEQARQILPTGLKNLGAEVAVAAAYRTLPAQEEKKELADQLQRGEVDVITFTSSSTVVYFLNLFSRQEILTWLKDVVIACIGPITAKTVRDNGLPVTVVAEEYTIPGLVEAIEKYFRIHESGVRNKK
jgi:uroporphyrinogen III methyltransferase / synthase